MSQEPLLSLQILYLETTMNSRCATMQHRTKTSVELLLSVLLQYKYCMQQYCVVKFMNSIGSLQAKVNPLKQSRTTPSESLNQNY